MHLAINQRSNLIEALDRESDALRELATARDIAAKRLTAYFISHTNDEKTIPATIRAAIQMTARPFHSMQTLLREAVRKPEELDACDVEHEAASAPTDALETETEDNPKERIPHLQARQTTQPVNPNADESSRARREKLRQKPLVPVKTQRQKLREQPLIPPTIPPDNRSKR